VLTAVLSSYLRARVALRQLCGAWRDIERSDRTRLGAANSRLGRDSVLGTHVWDDRARVEVTIGPLAYDRLCRLLPGESAYAGFAALLRFLVDRRFDCVVRLLLNAESLPEPRVTANPVRDTGAAGPAYWGLRLGQSAWLASRRARREPGQVREAVFVVPAFDAAEMAAV